MSNKLTVALAGNPNSGKTTIFNNLTGAHQHVGNYPGVTVEKKSGVCRQWHRAKSPWVDLPGIVQPDGPIRSRNWRRASSLSRKAGCGGGRIDASNLSAKSLPGGTDHGTGAPLVLAFNMSDGARGMEFNLDPLVVLALIVLTVTAIKMPACAS